MDLNELIERTMEQPTPLVLTNHLRDGRRALRRRRAPLVVGGGVVAAAITTFAVMAPLSHGHTATTTTASSPTATPAINPPSSANSVHGDQPPAGYDASGNLTVRPGWTVVQRMDHPVTVAVDDGGQQRVPGKSVALTISKGDQTQWVLSWWSRHSDPSSFTDWSQVDTGPRSLQDFINIEVATTTETATNAIVTVGDDDSMTGLNGVDVISQQATPQLDRAGTTTAVARATFPGEVRGKGWILLVRSADAVRTYPILFYPVVNSKTDDGPDTVAGFVQWIAPRVAQGRFP